MRPVPTPMIMVCAALWTILSASSVLGQSTSFSAKCEKPNSSLGITNASFYATTEKDNQFTRVQLVFKFFPSGQSIPYDTFVNALASTQVSGGRGL